jgi:hypothetical protein
MSEISTFCVHFAVQWMHDFEAFQAAVENDSSYSANLSRSLCLVLDEFYNNLRTVGVSAVTGEGMSGFFQAVEEGAEDYMKEYRCGTILHYFDCCVLWAFLLSVPGMVVKEG